MWRFPQAAMVSARWSSANRTRTLGRGGASAGWSANRRVPGTRTQNRDRTGAVKENHFGDSRSIIRTLVGLWVRSRFCPDLPVLGGRQFHTDQLAIAAGVDAATGVGGVRPSRANHVGSRQLGV